MNKEITRTEAAIYCRVSSATQVAKGHGIVSQETRCREFAERSGFQVARVFRDLGVSGNSDERPGSAAMLDYLRERKAGGVTIVVLIDEISRLARDLVGHVGVRNAIADAGGRLACPTFGFDTPESLLSKISWSLGRSGNENWRMRRTAR